MTINAGGTPSSAETSSIAVVVLGAGFGTRFGAEDKLGTLLGGEPVAHHVLAALQPFTWARKVLVCRRRADWTDAFERAGFTICLNPEPQKGMLGSLRTGVLNVGMEHRILVSLADMPLVSSAHIAGLLAASHADSSRIIASQAGDYRGPPAIFPPGELLRLPSQGEGGARSLLSGAEFVLGDADEFRDIDTRQDLGGLQA